MLYRVREAIGPYGVTLSDGETVAEALRTRLASGQPVEVDFEGVRVFASPFLNAAFAPLVRDHSREDLRRLISVVNLTPAGTNVLNQVLENARQYYSDPAVRKAVDTLVEEHAEAGHR